MKTIRMLWYVIKLFIFWVIGLLYFLVAAVLRFFDLWLAQKVFWNYLRLFLKAFHLNIQYEFSKEQTQNAKNTVFVLLNQSSFLDSLLPPPVEKIRGIINIEFALYPVVGWFMGITNFVIIRQIPRQAKNAINKTNNFLKSGGNIYISIEGKRSKDGALNDYKKGPLVMAINTQSDIVPIIIQGSFEALPYGALYIKPSTIKMCFLDPIPTKGLTYEHRNILREKLLTIAHNYGLQ